MILYMPLPDCTETPRGELGKLLVMPTPKTLPRITLADIPAGGGLTIAEIVDKVLRKTREGL